MISVLAIIFLILGIACQFTLTLAKSTTGIMGMLCGVISLALSIYGWRRSRDSEHENYEALIVGCLAAIVILVHAIQLPHNYELEKKYHQILENARETERQLEAESELE